MFTPRLPWKFHGNRFSRFLVILLTKKQRNKHTYKQRKKERKKERNRAKTIPRPRYGGGVINQTIITRRVEWINEGANAGDGTDAPQTRPVEFNAFLREHDHPHNLPEEPTVDLYIKLDMRDFHWAVHSTSLSTEYHVVCQTRPKLMR